MKNEFSNSWKESRQPRKQRKFRFNAPIHIKHKFLSAQLSKELRQKYGIRNIPVRKGDTVKITTGNFRGREGKVEKVFPKKTKVFVAGVHIIRADGRKSSYPMHPSNLLIKDLDLNDKKRKAIIERKSKPKIHGGKK